MIRKTAVITLGPFRSYDSEYGDKQVVINTSVENFNFVICLQIIIILNCLIIDIELYYIIDIIYIDF